MTSIARSVTDEMVVAPTVDAIKPPRYLNASQLHLERMEVDRAMPLILERLKKAYVGPDGSLVPVIDVEQFALASGEQVSLVGGSGTGKTTLLHLIAGILIPDSGRILYQQTLV